MLSPAKTILALGALLLASGCAALQSSAPSRCPVHDVEMARALAEVRSGAPSSEYEKARRELFPYPETQYGAEFTAPGRVDMVAVPICPECRRAEFKWTRENRRLF